MAVTTHSIYGRSDRNGVFYGEKGYIVVHNINNPQRIEVYDDNDQLLQHVEVPEHITGYEYEVRESMEMIGQGKLESESMPLSETIYVMELMDQIRNNSGW